MKRLLSLFVVITALFLTGVSANAQDLMMYGVATPIIERMKSEGALSAEMIEQTMFYSINSRTGASIEIGPTGFNRCSSLNFEPVTNELFAVCLRLDMDEKPVEKVNLGPEEVGEVLVKLDMLTGQGTEVGPLNMAEEKSGRVTDISFRSDGVLFAHVIDVNGGKEGKVEIDMVSNSYLGEIDTQSGQLQLIGPTGFDDVFSAIGFSKQDNLYHAADNQIMGALNMLSQTTGDATLLKSLIYPPMFTADNIITTMDADPFRGDLFAVLLSEDSLKKKSSEEAVDTRKTVVEGFFLIKIDPAGGGIDVVGETPDQLAAIAFLNNDRMLQVPTLSKYGLIITFVMFLGAAIIFLRRRQIKSEI